MSERFVTPTFTVRRTLSTVHFLSEVQDDVAEIGIAACGLPCRDLLRMKAILTQGMDSPLFRSSRIGPDRGICSQVITLQATLQAAVSMEGKSPRSGPGLDD